MKITCFLKRTGFVQDFIHAGHSVKTTPLQRIAKWNLGSLTVVNSMKVVSVGRTSLL